MKKDPRYGTEVKINNDTTTRSWSTRNEYAVDNVNVKQGPRTGNVDGGDLSAGKRSKFVEAKQARAPLARVIEDAYAKRQHEYEDYEYTNGGSIMDNVNEGPRKKRK